MTTPTLREAADTVEWMGEAYNDKPSIYCNSPAEIARWNNCVEHSKLAANTLRVIASAQSDAEKAFEAVWMSFDERDFPMTDDTFLDKEACKRIYAAGLAAQEAKVKALEAKWTKSREHYEDLADEQEAALATAKADLTELSRQRDVMIGKIQQHELDAAQSKLDILATKADAMELANEVRRCWALAQEGHDAEWDDHCGQCDDVIDNRPAAVTAAMERYAETQHG